MYRNNGKNLFNFKTFLFVIKSNVLNGPNQDRELIIYDIDYADRYLISPWH